MKNVLITGGTGFVGANLARHFIRAGHNVHLLIRSEDSAWRIEAVRPDFTWHTGCLENPAQLRAVIERAKPDWILHLAAYGAYSSQRTAERILQTNLQGTINLLDAAMRPGFEVFVNTGSSSEYGFCDHAPLESELPQPNSTYAYSKAAATMYCSFLAQQHDLRITTLRLYSAYGPFEDPTRFMPRLILRARDGAYPPLVEASVARDFVYVDDVSRAYEMVLTSASPKLSDIFNVGTGVQTTIGEAVDVCRETFAIAGAPQWGSMGNRSWDSGNWVANIDRISTEIGWSPTRDFRAGCSAMSDWFTSEPELEALYRREHQPPQ